MNSIHFVQNLKSSALQCCVEREREESINQFLTFHHRRHSEVAEKVLLNILIFQILRMQKWNINPTVLDGCMLVDVSTFLDA